MFIMHKCPKEFLGRNINNERKINIYKLYMYFYMYIYI